MVLKEIIILDKSLQRPNNDNYRTNTTTTTTAPTATTTSCTNTKTIIIIIIIIIIISSSTLNSHVLYTSCFISFDILVIICPQLCQWYLKWRIVVQVLTHLTQVKPWGQGSGVVIALLGFLNKRI